jgi:hypothetical protein
VTPAQCRAARELLGWSPERLGAASGVYGSVVYAFEANGRVINPIDRSRPVDRIAAIQAALEEAGIEFIDNGSGPGVRLRREDRNAGV